MDVFYTLLFPALIVGSASAAALSEPRVKIVIEVDKGLQFSKHPTPNHGYRLSDNSAQHPMSLTSCTTPGEKGSCTENCYSGLCNIRDRTCSCSAQQEPCDRNEVCCSDLTCQSGDGAMTKSCQ
ncbi:hypothetical protein GJ744_009541 [Endocarpon pusillum]|uniref:Uncharacterized protein n=1 Tax=Endocarpon pusillum TaxID=364733 RepID=A0A8H7AN46_9EURO|nr:hypothetical protein GJ744_009541 [Endocarpon pusillum]